MMPRAYTSSRGFGALPNRCSGGAYRAVPAACQVFSNPGHAIGESWSTVAAAYSSLVEGSIFNPHAQNLTQAFNPISETLVAATPLMLAGLGTLMQIGFALAFGVLIDTFVVRPFLVPAFAILCWKAGAPGPKLPVLKIAEEHPDEQTLKMEKMASDYSRAA